jgi:hypothetical protein|tara:strand:- start:4542 stop:4700 length:159 start_codon:yes stop_codon:yes gene_type:complete
MIQSSEDGQHQLADYRGLRFHEAVKFFIYLDQLITILTGKKALFGIKFPAIK